MVRTLQKQIIIHVGPPKTGTSAIQYWLQKNIHILTQNKILYPSHGVAKTGISSGNISAIYDVSAGKDMLLNLGRMKSLIKSFEESEFEILLLSSEFFLNKMKELKLHLQHVKFIFYLRNPIEVRESNYNQSVKRHGQTGIFNSVNNGYFPHLTKLSHYCKEFGNDDLIIKFYGKDFFKHGNIVSDFLEILGVGCLVESTTVNLSYQFEALELKRWLNQFNIERYQSSIDEALQNFKQGANKYSLLTEQQYAEQCATYVNSMRTILISLNIADIEIFFTSMHNKKLPKFLPQKLSEQQFEVVWNFLTAQLGRDVSGLVNVITKNSQGSDDNFVKIVNRTRVDKLSLYSQLFEVKNNLLYKFKKTHFGLSSGPTANLIIWVKNKLRKL